MMSFQYFNNCVSWDRNDVDEEGGLVDMINDAIDITRQTFLKHVDRDSLREVEASLNYEDHPKKGLTMAADWTVSYHRSKLHGKRVYFFKHSAIEYVFVKYTPNTAA
jgi:hypothetical protein